MRPLLTSTFKPKTPPWKRTLRFAHTLRAATECIDAQAQAELHGDASPGLLEATRYFSESKGTLTAGVFYALDAFIALMAENNRYIFRVLGVCP